LHETLEDVSSAGLFVAWQMNSTKCCIFWTASFCSWPSAFWSFWIGTWMFLPLGVISSRCCNNMQETNTLNYSSLFLRLCILIPWIGTWMFLPVAHTKIETISLVHWMFKSMIIEIACLIRVCKKSMGLIASNYSKLPL
jgi:hypothetical protein